MSLSIPSSISTGSTDSNWASLVPTPGASDTSTKKHYSAVSYTSAADLVFELNNGVVTVDVNPAGTGTDWPDSVSKTGFQTNGTSSITVTTNDTIYIFNNGSTNFGSFVWQSSWVTTSGGGTSTESLSYSGSLTVNGTSLEYEIPSTASSGTYMLMSSASATPQLNITHGSTLSSGSVPNFDQSKIWTLLSPIEGELARIDLTSTKKVFCNFW